MISKILKINLIKTLYYNIKIKGILSLFNPQIIIGYKCKINISNKKYLFLKDNARIFIGVFDSENRHTHNTKTYFNINGKIILKGRINISKGSDIFVHTGAVLEMEDLYLGPDCSIICNKHICFKEKCIVSWNCLFLDGDTHPIYNNDGFIINKNKEIIIGKNCWIGCNTNVLKGVVCADNIIISSSSVVTKSLSEQNYIYVSNQKKKYFKEFKIDEKDLFKEKEIT